MLALPLRQKILCAHETKVFSQTIGFAYAGDRLRKAKRTRLSQAEPSVCVCGLESKTSRAGEACFFQSFCFEL